MIAKLQIKGQIRLNFAILNIKIEVLHYGVFTIIDKDEFDYLIKKNLLDMLGNDFFCYEIAGRTYDVYYNREAYKKFIAEMQSAKYNKFYNQYNRGKGSELIGTDNRPPKMASVASSSRFCYLALRDGCKQFS